VKFFTNNTCDGDATQENTFTDSWDESTKMPQDGLLPKTGLVAGGYSYQESFIFDGSLFDAPVVGDCEPFMVVPPSSSSSGSTPPGGSSSSGAAGLPVTGGSLTGLIVGAVALIAGGAALVYFWRRRDATENPLT
jgi:LPXTG-motif cell wall-anchored protein